MRIGVIDHTGEPEIQDAATWQLNDLRGPHEGTLAEHLANRQFFRWTLMFVSEFLLNVRAEDKLLLRGKHEKV